MSPDEFKKLCEAVEGYTTLGLIDEAYAILESLPSELKVTKEVITLHLGIHVKSGEYLKASYLAETLSLSEPDDIDRLVMVAWYRRKAGDLKGALSWLQGVQSKCEKDAYYHYLSAKCHAGLGNLEAARESLNRTFAIAKNLKLKALDDPLFADVW